MTAERWQQIESLYHSALEHPPTERRAFVATVCSDDEELQRELESLLASHETAGDFIEEPVAPAAARALSDRQNAILIGREIGHYKVLSLLGKGGMGEVYLAEDTTLQRKVALKLFHTHLAGESEARERFMREARLASSLDHPNICTVYEVGEVEGRPFIAMRYVQGKTLKQLIAGQPLALESLFSISLQAADALAVAHSHGIIHRDIKTENIMVAPGGRVQVLDFGIAKLLEKEEKDTRLTMTGRVMGTPAAMSPEQARGQSVDERTDIFSLGAMMYEMGTGRLPFIGQTQADVVSALLKEPHTPAAKINKKIPLRFSAVIDRALAKDPAGRYQSMPKMISDLRQAEREPGGLAEYRTRIRWAAVGTALLLVAAMIASFIFASKKLIRSTSIVSDKSIAVLPFENLSEDKANAFFADGVQDEILTDLSKIADLKVISRTSVMHYKSGTARNLREIGQQLGVAHVVEGSVQRSANRVRVNAQLVDARTDRHLWAQTYDRDLADVFAIQSEIARAITDQLQAKLSPDERAAIERLPTTDVTAFDLYSHARTLVLSRSFALGPQEPLLEAIDLLNQAVARDPNFFPAYCQLANAHDQIYFLNFDHTPARLGLAEAAVQTALRLRPDAGEAHLALAGHLYWGYLDYDHARAEIAIAQRKLPNDPATSELTALIDRRQGRWQESIRDLERAMELDPRNVYLLRQIAANYSLMRRYRDAASVLDRALEIAPKDGDTRVARAFIDLQWHADTRPLHTTIESLRAENTVPAEQLTNQWLNLGLVERDWAECDQALAAFSGDTFRLGISDAMRFTRAFGEGLVHRVRGDAVAAQAAFATARAQQEEVVRTQPDYAPELCVLGLIDAGLGRKEEALREGRHAIELLPVTKDSINGAHMIEYFAVIAAWCGEKDLALEQLARVTRLPGYISYGYLRLHPFWDPLRGDPRFEKLVEEANQPVVLANLPLVPEKSIAVLPFQNLSEEKANEFFADGVQDEILTDLAKIADLKVISRMSVMQYKSGIARKLREIGQQLGVANVVEGSVQRAGNRVRVNAQLVDTRTDRHLWAQTYDRDLADVFAIQSEIAKTIADQLQAKLSPSEKSAIERPATSDVTAFDLYARAKNLLLRIGEISTAKANLLQAVDLLNQAVARDPLFFEAYCLLAYAHDALYWYGFDHTVARLASAEAAIKVAARLRPDAGETHLARAQNLYWGYRDYDGALGELEVARQTLPNDAQILRMTGLIQRRQGRWKESTPDLERSIELNPRDIELVQTVAVGNYMWFRRYAEPRSLLARALVLEPNDAPTKTLLADMDLYAKGDTLPLHQTIDSIRATNPAAVPSIANDWLLCALAERDAAAANAALLALGDNPVVLGHENVQFNRSFAEGLIARMTKDDDNARSAFTAARTEQEKIVQDQPNYGPALCVLGLIDAGLGRKEDALREGRRAVELLPVEKDAVDGPAIIKYLAMIAAWLGDKDLAFEQLGIALRIQSGVSYGELKLLPWWDPLRGDPRFEKILENAKQPVALK